MSFNTHARKVRDASLDIKRRLSHLRSCFRYVTVPEAFTKRQLELFGTEQLAPDNLPTHEQSLEAIDRTVAERNLGLERLRAYERRRIREKMRGRRSPPAA